MNEVLSSSNNETFLFFFNTKIKDGSDKKIGYGKDRKNTGMDRKAVAAETE